MPIDRSFIAANHASTERMRSLAARLSAAQFQQPVGEHWTVTVALAHIAFWDRRVLDVLDLTEQAGHLVAPEIDVSVNDLSLPLWRVLEPRRTAQIAVETAAALDARLEGFAPDLLEQVYARRDRWVVRALHRDEHLDEIEAALR